MSSSSTPHENSQDERTVLLQQPARMYNGRNDDESRAGGRVSVEDRARLTAETGGLKRGLSARQVQMIAIGMWKGSLKSFVTEYCS